MAEQIISPGVFTRENDLSFLPQGIGAIGAAIIGPTTKGPAFVPTVIKSFSEYNNRFGGLSQDTFVPQTVREYLKNAGTVTVCRVLAGGGYSLKNNTSEPAALIAGSSATDATSATGEIEFTGVHDGDTFLITGSDGTIHTFVFVDTPVPADVGNTHYVRSASNLVTSLGHLTQSIQNSASIAGTFAVSNSVGIEFTASAGTAGNNVGLESGSTAHTQVETGTDATIAGGLLLGVLFPSKHTSTPSLHTSTLRSTTNASHGIMSASFKIDLVLFK